MGHDESDTPTGTDFDEYINNLRLELLASETERDQAVDLLYEISETTDPEDIEETLLRIKKFLEVSF